MQVQFVVPGTPRGKQTPRVTRFGTFMPAQTAAEMEAIGYIAAAAMAGRLPLTGPLELRLCAYVPIPSSWSRAKRDAALRGEILPVTRPDGCNYQKLAEDACNAICWADDSQVVNWLGWKRYSNEPRLVVRASSLQSSVDGTDV